MKKPNRGLKIWKNKTKRAGGAVFGINGNEPLALQGTEPEHRFEQTKESISKLMSEIIAGKKDISPYIITVINNKPIIQKLHIDGNGKIQIPDLLYPTKTDIDRKKKIVRAILDKITPVLHADIENVTYTALLRKDEVDLIKCIEELENKEQKPRLQNRVGCIFLIVGDYEFML